MPAKKITKNKPSEREYVINIRREIMKVPRHKRTPKAVKAVKQFIARHMRVPDRDLKKIKLDKWINHELWFRGIKNPITKIKVKAKYDDNKNVRVELAEIPKEIKYLVEKEKKQEKQAKEIKKKEAKEAEAKEEEEKKAEEKQTDEKTEEEKEKSVEEAEQKLYQKEAKQTKHIESGKEKKVQPMRKALQK